MARRDKSKYYKHKKEASSNSSQPTEEPEKVDETVVELELKNKSLPFILVFALGFLLYANTIPFDYVLDDKLYITSNSFTKKGLAGLSEIWTNDLMTGFFGSKKNLVEGGRYRPLALTTHAAEWQLFKENPHISHFINIVLYGFIGVVLLMVLQRIFGWKENRWWWSIPFVTTLLYIAHPLHTEVAANIKSRDELMSLFFALLAFKAVFDFFEKQKNSTLVLSGFWFLLSLFSKESSITFLGVVPLTLIFFTKEKLKPGILAMSGMIGATLLYLAIRLYVFADQGGSLSVAQELMNKPYINATQTEWLASVFFTMALYLKLLVWPHPLTHDYYPFHPFRTYDELVAGARPYLDWSSSGAVLGVVIYAVILGYGLYALTNRLKGGKPNIIGYGSLLYFGTFILFSNLFFDIGAFMNERFLFIPSLGFSIIIAYLIIEKALPKLGQKTTAALLAIVLIAYAGQTISRNNAWENDRTLAMADVVTSDGSAKVKMTMGSELLDMAKEQSNPNEKTRLLKEAEKYCLQSLKIYPQYFPPLDIIGNVYFEMENYAYSVHYFLRAVQKKSNDTRLLNNLEAVGNVALEKGDITSAEKAYKTLAKLYNGADQSRILSALGELYGKHKQDLNKGKIYLKKAIKANPSNAAAYQKIGIVYAMTSQADSALYNFNRALELDPENARVLLNLAILYNQLGDKAKGEEFMQRAVEIDPNINARNR
ncbi:MAG: tetratricopeptide repeat protein [Salibacteraceae bacterium]